MGYGNGRLEIGNWKLEIGNRRDRYRGDGNRRNVGRRDGRSRRAREGNNGMKLPAQAGRR